MESESSQNQKMVWVGRDLPRSSSPDALLWAGTPLSLFKAPSSLTLNASTVGPPQLVGASSSLAL